MTVGAPDRTSTVRAVAEWRLLSFCLSMPTHERLTEIAMLAAALGEGERATDGLDALAAAAGAADPDDVAAAQARLFGGAVMVAPFEGSYEDDPFRQARQLADVAGFYRAFGVDAHGADGERADHAGCELEFLAFVAARRVALEDAQRDEDAAECLRLEGLFLTEHPGRWLPTFFAELEREATDPFHRAVAAVGRRVMDETLASRGIAAHVATPRRARRHAVEADALDCGTSFFVGAGPPPPSLHGV